MKELWVLHTLVFYLLDGLWHFQTGMIVRKAAEAVSTMDEEPYCRADSAIRKNRMKKNGMSVNTTD